MKRVEAGNALFLILIAVALFAALSYAITQSGRGGGGIDREEAMLGASGIMQIFNRYATAVDRLLMLGCTPEEISFTDIESPGNSGGGAVNPNSPPDRSCHVLDMAGTPGMGVAGLDGSGPANTYGDVDFHRNFGIRTPEGSKPRLVYMVIPYVSDAVCLQINQQLNGVSSIPHDTDGMQNNYQPYVGVLSAGPGNYTCETTPFGSGICGFDTGCFKLHEYRDYGALGTITSYDVNIAYNVVLDGN